MNKLSKVVLVAALVTTGYVSAAELNITHYNPGKNAIFPVSSVIVSGDEQAILFDAQFSTADGQNLVDQIKASGKTLTMIYISGGDPDYYFGLEPLVAAFPNVEIVASEAVVKHINQTKDAKLEYWGPILEDNAPSTVIVPNVLNDTTLILEGEKIEVKEINTHEAYLWVPSTKTVFGGVSVYAGLHVWTADTQSKDDRNQWVQSLEHMKELEPEVVIPGHYLGEMPTKTDGVQFTIDYIAHIEQALESAENPTSSDIINYMKMHYPHLESEGDLELGAQVLSGEMEWH